jgi:hypothetical protein
MSLCQLRDGGAIFFGISERPPHSGIIAPGSPQLEEERVDHRQAFPRCPGDLGREHRWARVHAVAQDDLDFALCFGAERRRSRGGR